MKEMGAALARCVCVGQNTEDEKRGAVYFTLSGEKEPIRIQMPIDIAREFRIGCEYRLSITAVPNPDAPSMN